ncbi:nicotinamide riboside transporter PnuC [Bifidobacterium pseudocatenulatum]|uniref:nicotinamide riboside transporter PnuC n=1 Tax=Bifidobacterium pseudocatenulatum TaxID=28026 RepID=UPI0022E14EFE|nr:nicotinamide riboside transporter PnuC [Bifidobacterium pseudocatenulatum]
MFNLILVDRGRLTNYLWGFIGCATWLIVAIMNHLVGDIFSQIFYVTMQFVGVWVWRRQLDRQEKKTSMRKSMPACSHGGKAFSPSSQPS